MKRTLLFAAVAAILMTSCANDIDIAVSDANLISFRVITDKNTRASEMTTTDLRNFKMYAYWDAAGASTIGTGTGFSPNFMYGVTVSRPDAVTAYTYSPEKYWPSEGSVHFFAYSPAASTCVTAFTPANDGTKGQPVIAYTVAATAAAQEDLLYAATENKKKAATPPTSAVNMQFKHALSQVIFAAKSGKESITFDIEKIELKNIANSNTLNLRSGAWGNTPTGSASYEYPLHATNKNNIGNTAFVTLTDATAGALMVLPQTLVGANPASNGPCVSVTYGAKDLSGAQIIDAGTVVTMPLSITFDKGNRYTFNLTMNGKSGDDGGDDELDPITFTADVEAWVNATDTGISM